MELKKIIISRPFIISLIVLGELIIIALVFSVGVHVGVRKGQYAFERGIFHDRMPGRQARGPVGPFSPFGEDVRGGHGLAGTISQISNGSITMKDREGNDHTVTVTDKTIVRSFGQNLNAQDLKQGDTIIVLGKPDDSGQISAELIRVASQR